MAGLYIRDNRVIVPALRDGAPDIGALSDMVITEGGVKFTNTIDVGTFTEIIAFAEVTEFTSGTVDIGFQISPDGKNFIDVADNFTQITAAGLSFKKITSNFGKYVRLKITFADPTDLTLSVWLSVKA
jgi:hypothetical protein